MRALVTGGNGFLGSAIVRMLRARGDQVLTFSRNPPSTEHAAFRVPHCQGDIRDPAVITSACEGIDVVFHVAALAGVWGKRRDFESINVDGTRNVINACRRARVKKLVYTSTPSVVFGRDDLCGVDESQPYPDHYLAAYPQTKAKAEQMVLAANAPTLATVALRPHLIFGPGDPHLIPRVIDRARKGKLRQVGDGKNLVDITYVDNAAEAHLLAADVLHPAAPCAGKAYFISQGEPVLLWRWLDELLSRVDAPRATKMTSFSSAYAAGAVLETAFRILRLRREPRMTRFVANQLARSHYFDISAARRDLGYRPRVSLSEGTERLVAWLRQFPPR